jgi:hypothetical protein
MSQDNRSEQKEERRGGIYFVRSAYHAVLAVKDERDDALAACWAVFDP